MHFILLVISIVSAFSSVSSQASKHLLLPTALHHTRSASIVAYLSNAHCPHLLRQMDMHYLLYFLLGGGNDTITALRSSRS